MTNTRKPAPMEASASPEQIVMDRRERAIDRLIDATSSICDVASDHPWLTTAEIVETVGNAAEAWGAPIEEEKS